MDLNKIRQDIDRIDSSIKPLFIERMACGYNVAKAKEETGGDVYAPIREKEVIAARTADVSEEIKAEYEAFLLHLMSLCRRYEYGLLTNMQEDVLSRLLGESAISEQMEHSRVKVAFACDGSVGGMNLVLNMITLNDIPLANMHLEAVDGVQHVTCTLEGNITEKNMKLLLCQLAKETAGFKIIELL